MLGFRQSNEHRGELKWTPPRALEDWEWREGNGGAMCRRVFALFWKWGVLLGVPPLLAVRYWAPEMLGRTGVSLVAMLGACSVLLPLQVWLGHKVGTRYKINRKGLWRFRTSTRQYMARRGRLQHRGPFPCCRGESPDRLRESAEIDLANGIRLRQPPRE